MSDEPSVQRLGRRRPFDFAKRRPHPGRYPPDGLDLDAATEAIATAPIEIGYGFDSAGRQVFRQVGFEDALTGFRPEDLARLRDGVFLHNHPPYDYPAGDPRRRAGSFSANDLVFMYEHDLAELVVVTEQRRYRLRRRPDGFYLDPSQIRHAYRVNLRAIRRRLVAHASRGEISGLEAAAEGRLADEVMERMAAFFEYSVEERR